MFLLYILLSCCLIFFEFKKYKSLISPASLIAISYLISFSFAKLGESFFYYDILDDRIYLLIIFVLIIAWLPSFILPIDYNNKIVITIENNEKVTFPQNFLLYILLVFCFIGFLFSLLHGGIATESFEKAYSHGIFAHIRNLFSILITFLILFKNKNKFLFLEIFFCFILMFLSGTKYHVIFLFLPIVLYSLDNPQRKTVLKIFIICFISVSFLFALNYIFSFFMRGIESKNILEFLLNHFVMYVGGGIIGLSNLLFKNTHQYSGGFVSIDMVGLKQTNVFTFFGSLYQNYGFIQAFVILFCLSFLGYLLFFFYKKKADLTKKVFFIAYCNFIGIPFLLSFFASYYRLSRTYELFILSFSCLLFYQRKFFTKVFKYEVF